MLQGEERNREEGRERGGSKRERERERERERGERERDSHGGCDMTGVIDAKTLLATQTCDTIIRV